GAEVAEHFRVDPRPEEGEVPDVLVDLALAVERGGVELYVALDQHLGDLFQPPSPRIPQPVDVVGMRELDEAVGARLGHAGRGHPQMVGKRLLHDGPEQPAQRMIGRNRLRHDGLPPTRRVPDTGMPTIGAAGPTCRGTSALLSRRGLSTLYWFHRGFS